VLFQAVLKNPLADPGIIGISSGAGFVAAIVVAYFPMLFFITPLLSFIGGMLACMLVYSLSYKNGFSPLRIILVGVAVNSVFSGLSSAFGSMSGQNYQSASELISANISMKTWDDVRLLAIYVVIGLVLAMIIANRCNLLALEDKTVRGLGVNVTALRAVVSVVAVLLASITTAVAGSISFVGLIVPHIARLIVGSEHKRLIPFSALLGAFVMLLADTVGRLIAYPYEISPAIIMSVVGGPVFIILLKRSDKTYGN
jgi:iron complex transport system permease protein